MSISSTRRAVSEGILDVLKEDKSVVLVSSDSALVIKAQDIIEDYPDNYVEMGISEQAAMAASAGLASCGLKPVYVSYAVFATLRACEQFRNAVAYPGLDVKIVGANGGMASGEREGVTHQGLEDIGIVRTIPGITVLSPSDAGQVRKAAKAMFDIPGPVYLRTGSGRDLDFWPEDTEFIPGKTRPFFDSGSDIVIFAHGFVLSQVQSACEVLTEKGIRVKAVEVATIKPLNEQEMLGHLQDARAVMVVEDHNVIGGLGSAVTEFVCDFCPKKVLRMGLNDRFSESGSPDELYKKYGLTEKDIVEKAIKLLQD